MENTQSKMGKQNKPFYKKINVDNTKIWALWGQVIFALFVIIAFYAISFEAYKIGGDKGNVTKYFLSDFATNSDVFGLGVTGLVFVFVAIAFPAVSFFYKNDNVNFWLGWSEVLFDIVALATVTAAIGMFASANHEGAVKALVAYDDGYLAGQFIFELLGAIIAGLGIYSSYKQDLLNKEVIKTLVAEVKSPKANKKSNKKVASKTVNAKSNGKNDDVVIIGDEDNKSFKTQEKEINRVNKKEEKQTKKDAEAVFGDKSSKNTKASKPVAKKPAAKKAAKPAAKKPAAKKPAAKKPAEKKAAKKPVAKKAAPKKNTKPAAKKPSKNIDAVVIGDEDNKSFKTQEKEIERANKKQAKATKKDAEIAFGAKESKSDKQKEKEARKAAKAKAKAAKKAAKAKAKAAKQKAKEEAKAKKREEASAKKLAKQKKTIL